jgi:hypothetical protein
LAAGAVLRLRPEPFWRMTGRELLEGCNAANTMIDAEIKARARK